ncbi:flagellar basal body-associated FliL family protein [Candidatus Enterovibrio escicola]|uniref:flagellar basal body-associated FliL family protein n=1 Tax=Candidatus Enterovibrio escicola TaxID=1927127 RepID=UPI001237B27B|nr:flagellar basal body-associated FliL family protein [Candidatus Enterovibrio escacola]
MHKNRIALFTLLMALLVSFPSTAKSDEEVIPYSYFTLEPEITTNFITGNQKLGFINVRIDLMVDDPSLIQLLKYHQPLIRDTIIGLLSQEHMAQIQSLSGREAIRNNCLEKVNALLLAETNQKVLIDLLFTKYLYQ